MSTPLCSNCLTIMNPANVFFFGGGRGTVPPKVKPVKRGRGHVLPRSLSTDSLYLSIKRLASQLAIYRMVDYKWCSSQQASSRLLLKTLIPWRIKLRSKERTNEQQSRSKQLAYVVLLSISALWQRLYMQCSARQRATGPLGGHSSAVREVRKRRRSDEGEADANEADGTIAARCSGATIPLCNTWECGYSSVRNWTSSTRCPRGQAHSMTLRSGDLFHILMSCGWSCSG